MEEEVNEWKRRLINSRGKWMEDVNEWKRKINRRDKWIEEVNEYERKINGFGCEWGWGGGMEGGMWVRGGNCKECFVEILSM